MANHWCHAAMISQYFHYGPRAKGRINRVALAKGLVFPVIIEVSWESSRLRRWTRLPESYGSACQIVQRYHPGDLFLAREDGQPAKASLPHELFSLFDVLVLKATNEVGTHVIAYGRRVGVVPVSGGPAGNIAIGHHPYETLALADWQRAQVE
jgi:hypothetical protein